MKMAMGRSEGFGKRQREVMKNFVPVSLRDFVANCQAPDRSESNGFLHAPK